MVEPIGVTPDVYRNQAPTLDISGAAELPAPGPDPTNPHMVRNPAHAPPTAAAVPPEPEPKDH